MVLDVALLAFCHKLDALWDKEDPQLDKVSKNPPFIVLLCLFLFCILYNIQKEIKIIVDLDHIDHIDHNYAVTT